MPNQNNFRSNINKSEPRFLASRLVRLPEEELLLEEIPASFGYDNEDVVEIHFYTVQENALLLSLTAPLNSGILKSHLVSYDDNTYKNYLQIDFTKLFVDKSIIFIPGEYRVVFNFFSDEIGSYDDRQLEIKTISPSRTEIAVGFPPITPPNEVLQQFQQDTIYEFTTPAFSKPDAVGIMEKIVTSGVRLNDSGEGMTTTNVLPNIQNPERTINALTNAELLTELQEKLDDFIPRLFETVRREIVTNDDIYLQKEDLITYLRYAISVKIGQLQNTMNRRVKIN